MKESSRMRLQRKSSEGSAISEKIIWSDVSRDWPDWNRKKLTGTVN
jgi:hypothetical protein